MATVNGVRTRDMAARALVFLIALVALVALVARHDVESPDVGLHNLQTRPEHLDPNQRSATQNPEAVVDLPRGQGVSYATADGGVDVSVTVLQVGDLDIARDLDESPTDWDNRVGPADPSALAALLYCHSDTPRNGLRRTRLMEGDEVLYESVCTADGRLLSILEDRDGNGIPDRTTFVYGNDVVLEQLDIDDDGERDGQIRYDYDTQGRLVQSRVRSRTENGWVQDFHETRNYEGRHVAVRTVDANGGVLEQNFEGSELVSQWSEGYFGDD